jgi:hypothetical protein
MSLAALAGSMQSPSGRADFRGSVIPLARPVVGQPGRMSAGRAPRLLDRVRTVLRTRHYSARTEEAYVHWIRRFIFFHDKRHPAELAEPDIERFLSALATERHVSASTQNQALAALLFLYGSVLERKLGWLENVVRAKRPERLPVVLTHAEVAAVLEAMEGVEKLCASLLYGSGLRVLEVLRLRIKEVDFAGQQLHVRDGKGRKDRVPSCPHRCSPPFAGTSTACAPSISSTSGRDGVSSSCPMPCAPSTRPPPKSGRGSGSFRRRATTPIVRPASAAATICTRPFSNAPSTGPALRRA